MIKTPVQQAIDQIDADIEALRVRQGQETGEINRAIYLSERISLERFRKVLAPLLPVEQQMMCDVIRFADKYRYVWDEEQKCWDSPILDGGLSDTKLLQLFTNQNEGK